MPTIKTKHESMWLDVDGEMVHFQADPNMSEETREALKDLVRCVRKALQEGTLGKKKGGERGSTDEYPDSDEESF